MVLIAYLEPIDQFHSSLSTFNYNYPKSFLDFKQMRALLWAILTSRKPSFDANIEPRKIIIQPNNEIAFISRQDERYE
jgi:hypothetical protein